MNHIFCPVHWWVWSISEPPKAFLASVKSSLVRKGHSMSIWSSTWDKDLKSVLISDGKWMNMHVITMNKLDKCASPISKICHRCHSQVIFVVTRKALQHITDVSQKHASPEVLCNPLSAIPSDSLVPETCSLFATWLLETNLKTQPGHATCRMAPWRNCSKGTCKCFALTFFYVIVLEICRWLGSISKWLAYNGSSRSLLERLDLWCDLVKALSMFKLVFRLKKTATTKSSHKFNDHFYKFCISILPVTIAIIFDSLL